MPRYRSPANQRRHVHQALADAFTVSGLTAEKAWRALAGSLAAVGRVG